MSLAISRFLLTVLAASPAASDQPAPMPAVVWCLDTIRHDMGTAIETSGEPASAQLANVPALKFDGDDDALFVPSNPLVGAEAFTIEALIAPAVDGPEAQRFLHIEDGSGRRILLELRLDRKHGWSLDSYIHKDAENRCALLDRNIRHPVGEWHWVALRFDRGMMAHFVDGVPQGEGQVAFEPMSEGRTSLGVRLNRVSWYRGMIGEVRFHSVALAAKDMQRR